IDDETKAVAGWVLDQILVMLHPFMPFITEELWHAQADYQGGKRPYELIVAEWPQPGAAVDAAAKADVEWLIELINQIRSLKNEYNVPPGKPVPLHAMGVGMIESTRLSLFGEQIKRMGRVIIAHAGSNSLSTEQVDRIHVREKGIQFSVGNDIFALILLDLIDVDAEKARLSKALDASVKERNSLEKRLSNPAFVE